MKTHRYRITFAALTGSLCLNACDPKDSTSAPTPVPVDESQGSDLKPAPSDTGADAPRSGPESYVGLRLEEAEKIADQAGLRHRVISIDGEEKMVTQDFIPDRLNFTVENGIVTAVKNG
ncbi:hypothetical protein JIN85_07860 [Luteolibacter pohnpeiensis]|uniref:Peptidase inhibitor I78 family protein n=1 Tax=Luteolibacter pohnpeiensis TaxID=454153 RepID=A0A934S369_9BACT|nr:hypothetical protein [Luteolibacter pohnpeiensis]MBK1882325.1 hypothetical protein [Luteolibacter pohnpeiensis]